MRKTKRLNYKKLFRQFSKKITGIFEKKKSIKDLFRKENKYVHFFKKLFKKRDRKLQNAKIAISSFVLFFTTITVVSFLVTNKETTVNQPEEKINYDFMHWAATWRDFLFEWETGHDSNLTINENQPDPSQVLYSWTMNVNTTWTNTSSWWRDIIEDSTWSTNTGTNIATWENIKDPNLIILPTDVSKYIIRKLKEQIKQQQLLTETVKKDCISPRKTEVKNGEFILAYTQRTDVTNLCNVEKRYCNDWVLWWTYNQEKCDEKAKYEYQEAEVKSYTQTNTDTTYTQPTKPKNDSANFSVDGKINQANTENTQRYPSESWTQTNSKETWLKYIADPLDCKDPQWNVVKNWQFITAYKTPVGFIDLECKSEYRYCRDGKLGWSYSYQTCKYKDMTYNDYLVGNTDTDKATVLDLMESIDTNDETDSESIRAKMESLFR